MARLYRIVLDYVSIVVVTTTLLRTWVTCVDYSLKRGRDRLCRTRLDVQ
jgi:hypothetical protein